MKRMVYVTKNFLREYKACSKQVQQKIRDIIPFILETPRHPGLNTKKHREYGSESVYRSKVTSNYRILWQYDNEDNIVLQHIGAHTYTDRRLNLSNPYREWQS